MRRVLPLASDIAQSIADDIAVDITGVGLAYQALLNLFSSGESGLLFPSANQAIADGRLYQDSAGTTLASAVNDPGGLALEYHKRTALGVEKIVNGGFDENLDGWTAGNGATISLSDGMMAITGSDVTNPKATTTVTGLEAGVTYKFSTTTFAGTWAGDVVARVDGELIPAQVAAGGTVTGIFTASATSHAITVYQVVGGDGLTFYVDDVSVREIPGNHLSQTTATARSLLKQDGSGNYYLEFDGTDDQYTATLPTISSGTVVLIGTNGILIDDTFSHTAGTWTIGYNGGSNNYTGGAVGALSDVGGLIGLVVIDRQLTAGEQSAVNSYGYANGAPEVLL